MKSGALYRLAAVFLILTAGALLLSRVSRPPKAPTLLSPEAARKIVRVEISGPTGNFVFSKSSASWSMQSPISYPADPASFSQGIDKLGEIGISNDVTSDPSRYPQFDISDSSAARVRAFSSASGGSPGVDFYVGKEGSDSDSFYIRFAGKPGVMLAEGASSRSFNRLPGEWLDKTIVSIQAPDITELSARVAGASVRLRHDGDQWFPAGSKAAVSTAAVQNTLNAALQTLANLQGERVLLAGELTAKDKAALAKPDIVLDIKTTKAGPPIDLKFGKPDDRLYRCVQKSGEARVYFLLSDWHLEPLRRKDFAKLMAVNSASIKGEKK